MPPIPTNGNRDADIADEIADYVSAGLNMTTGTDFFIGELPEPNINGTPIEDGIYIVQQQGPAPDGYVDTETYILDFWSSSQDSKEGKVLLRRIYDILNRKGNYSLVNWYIFFSLANSTIRDEGRGREGNKLFSLSVTLTCRNLNNIS